MAKILIYGINYTPDLTGIGKYTGEMGAWMAQQGHEVEVITAMPYYPQWQIAPSYKGKLWHTENIAGVKVKRCPLYVPAEITGVSRMIHEFSFFLSSSVFWIAALFKKYDSIITPYPPLIIGIWPCIYKYIHPKVRWVFHIQDLQVDAARELNLIKNNRLLNALSRIELFWLRKADNISSISDGMKKRILAKGISEDKYIMLPNWADTEHIQPLPTELSMRGELGISADTRVILYSGNLGEKQGVDMIVDAACILKDRRDILFLIAGEGASKDRLIKYTDEKGVNENIRFLSLQPYNTLASFLAVADLHLVLQKKSAADLVLPSKLISILSSGGVALVTAEPSTSLYEMVHDYRLGFICEPDNTEEFVETILIALGQDTNELSVRARTYAENHLSIDAILKRFEHQLM